MMDVRTHSAAAVSLMTPSLCESHENGGASFRKRPHQMSVESGVGRSTSPASLGSWRSSSAFRRLFSERHRVSDILDFAIDPEPGTGRGTRPSNLLTIIRAHFCKHLGLSDNGLDGCVELLRTRYDSVSVEMTIGLCNLEYKDGGPPPRKRNTTASYQVDLVTDMDKITEPMRVIQSFRVPNAFLPKEIDTTTNREELGSTLRREASEMMAARFPSASNRAWAILRNSVDGFPESIRTISMSKGVDPVQSMSVALSEVMYNFHCTWTILDTVGFGLTDKMKEHNMWKVRTEGLSVSTTRLVGILRRVRYMVSTRDHGATRAHLHHLALFFEAYTKAYVSFLRRKLASDPVPEEHFFKRTPLHLALACLWCSAQNDLCYSAARAVVLGTNEVCGESRSPVSVTDILKASFKDAVRTLDTRMAATKRNMAAPSRMCQVVLKVAPRRAQAYARPSTAPAKQGGDSVDEDEEEDDGEREDEEEQGSGGGDDTLSGVEQEQVPLATGFHTADDRRRVQRPRSRVQESEDSKAQWKFLIMLCG